nr:EOG090X0MTI [Sida crystallina]
MAGASGRYVKSKNANPFFDEDELEDVDDEMFLQKAPNKPSSMSSSFNMSAGTASSYKYSNLSDKGGREKATGQGQSFATMDDDRAGDRGLSQSLSSGSLGKDNGQRRLENLLERKRMVEQRTLESTQRSIRVLHETEQVGISTAEELVRQREQLERTGVRLDEMNNSLRSSEKHIQNIKSVFSSIKNYFSKPSDSSAGSKPLTSSASLHSTSSGSNSQLEKALEQSATVRSQQPHPGLRTRGLTDDFDHKPLQSDVDDQLDENLGVMSQSLFRLKGLAQGLSSEIDDQNKLLDGLQISADKADWRVQRQNKDMERLLKK